MCLEVALILSAAIVFAFAVLTRAQVSQVLRASSVYFSVTIARRAFRVLYSPRIGNSREPCCDISWASPGQVSLDPVIVLPTHSVSDNEIGRRNMLQEGTLYRTVLRNTSSRSKPYAAPTTMSVNDNDVG